MRGEQQLKPRLLFVGSFVDEHHRERGGQQAECLRLVSSSLGSRAELLLVDSTTPYLPTPPLRVRIAAASKRLLKYVVTVVRKRPDAALIFSSGGLSFLEKGLMCAISRACGASVLWAVRAGVFGDEVESHLLFRAIARHLVRVSHRMLCQGESWARFYTTRLGLPSERVIVLHNTIDPRPFLAIPVRDLPANRPLRILFVGWIARKKGVFELLDALTSEPELADVEADVVGGGDDFVLFRETVVGKGLQDRVRVHGWLKGEALVRRFAEADLFVLPSYAEGFPNVVLEAMAAALPIVATPVGAIPDVIRDGVHGLLVPPHDPFALGRAIAALKREPELRRRMAERNRADVVANHSIEEAAEKLFSLLCTLSPAFAHARAAEEEAAAARARGAAPRTILPIEEAS